jgi:hypothetical protein
VLSARLAFILDARRDVYSVSKDVIAVDNDVADGYSDPELDIPPGPFGRSHSHSLLNRHRAGHCIHHAAKLNQHAVAGGLDDSSLMGGDRGIDDLAPVRLQCRERANLVGTHQPRITHDIGC